MASPLDITLIRQFDFIFPFLLVFAFVYAGLSFMNAFKGNKALHAIVALVLAFMTLFSPLAVRTITLMSPMFVIFMIFLFFGLMIFMTLGPKETDVVKVLSMKENQFAWWWILAIVLLIGFGAFFKALAESGGVPGYSGGGTTTTTTTTGGTPSVGAGAQEEQFYATLFHPKVLGLIFVMLLGLFTINRLASAPTD